MVAYGRCRIRGGLNDPLLRRTLLPAAPALLLGLTACDSCGRDKPHVPFTTSSSASAGPSETAAPEPAPSFAIVEADAPPNPSAVFSVGGREVRARSGRVFRAALTFDADGDDVSDLIALTEATDGRKAELAYFPGGDRAAAETTLASLPKELDLDRCARRTRLARIAPTIAVLEVDARCAKDREETWLAVVRLDAARSKSSPRPPELRLEIRTGEAMKLALASDDKDHDGHADLVATAGLRSGPEDLGVALVFLDRPAGFALDPSEPEQSFKTLAKKLVADAAKADVSERAVAMVTLARAVCDDLGEATLKTSSGPAKCGESTIVADALLATGLSHARAGDVGRAAMAWEALGAVGAAARRSALEAALDKVAKPAEATVVRRVAARPTTKKGVLAPFAWTSDDELMVESDSSVVKVDVGAGTEGAADALAWPRGVAWRNGDTSIDVLGASRTCDPVERRVHATAREAKTSAVLPSVLDIIPRGTGKSACKPGSLPLAALSTSGDGATIAVGAEVFRLTFDDRGLSATPVTSALGGTALSPPGAARSADGKVLALSLEEGLLVSTASGVERWRGAELAGLGPCVPNAAASRVACLTSNQDSVVIVAKK